MRLAASSYTDTLKKQLRQNTLDIVDVIAIPSGDRVKRLKALQEILVSMSEACEKGAGEYLIRVRHKESTPFKEFSFPGGTPIIHSEKEFHTKDTENSPSSAAPLEATDKREAQGQRVHLGEIYLTSGKLNIPYLLKNADLLLDAGDYQSARKIYNTILKSGEYTSVVLQRLGRITRLQSAHTKVNG